MDVPVLNMKGVEIGTLAVDAEALGGEINPALIKQAYVRYHAHKRQGSARSKNREAVSGSTRKIYKQKGTGRARHGDKKVPQFRGGGHAHSKKRTREDFRQAMPKKMRRKANLNALLAKLVDNEVRVLDSLGMTEPRTRVFLDLLAAIKVDRSALVAVGSDNATLRRSARNVDSITTITPAQLNVFDMLNHRYLVITRADLEGFLSGPQAQTTKDAKINPLGREASKKKERE